MLSTKGCVDVVLKGYMLTNLVNKCKKIMVEYEQVKNETLWWTGKFLIGKGK